MLKVTVRGLEAWMAKKIIPYYRIGKRSVRFKRSDILAHLDAKCRVNARS
jgi:excisionase family DNA binding protein